MLRDKKQQDKWLKDIFCSCAPRESKKPFFLGIIKDELGQKVGDEGEGTTRCQINVPLLQKGEYTGHIATTLQTLLADNTC